MTYAGTQVQQWDPRTGRQLARFDAATLLPPASDGTPPEQRIGIRVYPAENQLAVTIFGDPTIRIVDLTTGRVTGTVTAADHLGVQFDRDGRAFALLRQGSVVELWRRDPPRRDIGPLYSLTDIGGTPWYAGFMPDGRYLIAANNAVRIYEIGTPTPVDSYEFGRPDGSRQTTPYSFISASRDGSTVLYADEDGVGGPLALDPAVWQRGLCEAIGHRGFTDAERATLPVPAPTRPVCPAS